METGETDWNATPFDDGALYDLFFEQFDYGLKFYLDLAQAAGGPVLDVACGTGRVMLPMLKAGSSGYYSSFTSGWGNVTVVYEAGYYDPPRAARLRARQYVQALWQTSQQAPAPFVDESSPEAFVSAGLVPVAPPGYQALMVAGVA